MAEWTWGIGPATGTAPTRELTAAHGRRLTARLERTSDAAFTLNGRHDEASALTSRATDLHIRRDGRKLFRGRIGEPSDTVDATTHTTNVPVADYREFLRHARILYDTDTLAWLTTDQAAIAWALIQQTQAKTGGALGITQGVGATSGIVRDASYEAGASIGEAIDQLAGLINGFDWDINPDMQLDLWHNHSRGNDNGVILDYGGMLTHVDRQPAGTGFANAIRLNGTPALLDVETREVAGLATAPEGRWDGQFAEPSILDAATLDDRADWLITQVGEQPASYTVTFRSGRWTGPDHVWLGDTVRLVVNSGRLGVNEQLRVFEIDVTLDGNGHETVRATLGSRRRDLREQLQDQATLLGQLAR